MKMIGAGESIAGRVFPLQVASPGLIPSAPYGPLCTTKCDSWVQSQELIISSCGTPPPPNNQNTKSGGRKKSWDRKSKGRGGEQTFFFFFECSGTELRDHPWWASGAGIKASQAPLPPLFDRVSCFSLVRFAVSFIFSGILNQLYFIHYGEVENNASVSFSTSPTRSLFRAFEHSELKCHKWKLLLLSDNTPAYCKCLSRTSFLKLVWI